MFYFSFYVYRKKTTATTTLLNQIGKSYSVAFGIFNEFIPNLLIFHISIDHLYILL